MCLKRVVSLDLCIINTGQILLIFLYRFYGRNVHHAYEKCSNVRGEAQKIDLLMYVLEPLYS